MPKQLHAVEPLLEKLYPRFYDLNYPYAVARSRYRKWIRDLLESGGATRVLDCGCGDGYHSVTAELIQQNQIQLIGVDVAFAALSGNRLVKRRAAADAESLPFENSSFDLIVCESVLEHLLVPEKFLQEAYRVLQPCGRLMILTSGRWHPFMLINRWLNAARLGAAKILFYLLRRPLTSTFPAFYRCNSKRALAKQAAAAGFRIESLHVASGTFGYLRFSKWLIILGVLFDRITDNRLLDFSKISLLAVLQKP
jgi:ubiquinone/menaquinone biosynthesis C-methylase UbiE